MRTLALLKQANVNVREVIGSAEIAGSFEELLSGGIRGLDPERLNQLNARATSALATLANHQDGRPTFRADDWPMLLYCLLSSRTLREAITRTSHFYCMLGERWGRLDLHVQGGNAEIRMDALRSRRNAIAFVVDATGLAVHHGLFSWLIGCRIPLSAILMDYGADLRPNFDPATLPHPLTLNAGKTALCFPAHYLDYPVVRTSDDKDDRTGGLGILFALQDERARSLLAERARRSMYAVLRERHAPPTLEELADRLDCTVSTLRRNLARDGMSYNLIKDSCRRELALDLLRRSTLSIEDIATRLGFCDSDAFRRAFRGWIGMSPLQYRKNATALAN